MKRILPALFTALAFTMEFAPGEASSMDIQTIYQDLSDAFGGTAFYTTVLWGVFYFVSGRIEQLHPQKTKLIPLLSLVLAGIWTMGESFQIDNTLNALHASWVQIVKTVVYMGGMTYLLIQMMYLFEWIMVTADIPMMGKRWNDLAIARWYRKSPFLMAYVVISIGALPQLILCYPAGLSYDARLQLLYYFGLVPFSSHHPPFSTWVMGKIVSLGLAFGSANLGVFLYCVLQYLVFCVLMAYLLYTLRIKLHAPWWLQISTLIISIIAPYHAAYIGVMIKDVIYSYMILLLVIELIYLLYGEKCGNRHYILLAAASVIAVLYRNNGKYVVYPTLFILVIVAFCRKSKLLILKNMLIMAGVVLLSGTIESYFACNYVEEKGSVREALSLPFQQTARYVRQYGDEVCETEKQIIDQVLVYEELAELYDPTISDPVKATYRNSATKEDLCDYFGVWFRQFLRHPWCYVEAAVNQNYFMVYPKAELYAYFSEVTYEEALFELLESRLDLHEVDSQLFQMLSTLQPLYVGATLLLPGVGMLSNVGIYNVLFLFIVAFACKKHYNKVLVLSVPLVLTDLIVFAAPYVGPRYLFPILYGMPCVIALYIEEYREKRYAVIG